MKKVKITVDKKGKCHLSSYGYEDPVGLEDNQLVYFVEERDLENVKDLLEMTGTPHKIGEEK